MANKKSQTNAILSSVWEELFLFFLVFLWGWRMRKTNTLKWFLISTTAGPTTPSRTAISDRRTADSGQLPPPFPSSFSSALSFHFVCISPLSLGRSEKIKPAARNQNQNKNKSLWRRVHFLVLVLGTLQREKNGGRSKMETSILLLNCYKK